MSLDETSSVTNGNGHNPTQEIFWKVLGAVAVAGVLGGIGLFGASAVQSRDVEDLQATMEAVERKLDQVVTKSELSSAEQKQREYADSKISEIRPELASQRAILERVEKRIDDSLDRVEKAIDSDRQASKEFREKMRDEMGAVKLRVEQQSLK